MKKKEKNMRINLFFRINFFILNWEQNPDREVCILSSFFINRTSGAVLKYCLHQRKLLKKNDRLPFCVSTAGLVVLNKPSSLQHCAASSLQNRMHSLCFSLQACLPPQSH